jgi:hypothetical protein
MADISKFTLPNGGGTYNLKDAAGRTSIDTLTAKATYDEQAINGMYAGRNLQTVLGVSSFDAAVSALHTRAAAANFTDLRVGDFINVACGAYGTVRFDIAHFDPYYQMGSSAMGHHICFVAHTPIALPSGDAYGTGTNNTYLAWNTTNTNQGTEAENCPYLCSHLHDWEINKLLPAMPTSLTNNLINRWEYLETRYAAAGGLTASTGRTLKQLGKVWSLSEMEVYGAVVWGTPGQSVGIDRQFDIILRKTFNDSPTLYMNPAMDITNEIIDGLNKEYKTVKSKKK